MWIFLTLSSYRKTLMHRKCLCPLKSYKIWIMKLWSKEYIKQKWFTENDFPFKFVIKTFCSLIKVFSFQHYDAIMKYVNQGPLFVDVHMHRPHTTSRHFMDALLAFWPGLQVHRYGSEVAVILIAWHKERGPHCQWKQRNLSFSSSHLVDPFRRWYKEYIILNFGNKTSIKVGFLMASIHFIQQSTIC